MGDYEVLCEAEPMHETSTLDQTSTHNQVMFFIQFSTTHSVYTLDDDGYEILAKSWNRDHKCYIERDKLMDDNTNREELEVNLAFLDIPNDSNIFFEVLSCARKMNRLDSFRNKNVWPMKVKISYDRIVDRYESATEEEEDDDEDKGEEFVQLDTVPVMVSEDSINRECCVCLKVLVVGSEATSLPCLHIFHGDCILRWLHRTNSCPLCRSKIVK